jgi:hypothetical protein
MKSLLAVVLLSVPTLLSSGAAYAQYYNPYTNQYRQCNQSFPGYQGGNGDYRRQVREMNPYGSSYIQYQQEQRSSSWGRW